MSRENSKRAAFQALADRVVQGDGEATPDLRALAFSNTDLPPPLGALIGKVAMSPAQVSDADFAAAKAAGYSEDQLFELVVAAAIGQSARQYDAGLAALTEAAGDSETN